MFTLSYRLRHPRSAKPLSEISRSPWDETKAGLASTIQIIELTEKLAVIEAILELKLHHDSWDRNHKALLLNICSQAYQTEKTLVEVVASTFRGIQNGTETQKNLKIWINNLANAEEESRKAEAMVENLRRRLWNVVFDSRKAAVILGSRELTEVEEQIIQTRREDFRRSCRRVEKLEEQIKDVTIQEKIKAANSGKSLLVAFLAPRSMICPPENNSEPEIQSSSETIRKREKDARRISSRNGKSFSELADLTTQQKRQDADFQERRLALLQKVDNRMQRYYGSRGKEEPEVDFELSGSENEAPKFTDPRKVKILAAKNRPIDEELDRRLKAACKSVAYKDSTTEQARKSESTRLTPPLETEEAISPVEVAHLIDSLEVSENSKTNLPDTPRNETFRQNHDNEIGLLQEEITSVAEDHRKERRQVAREREERIVADEESLKHKQRH